MSSIAVVLMLIESFVCNSGRAGFTFCADWIWRSLSVAAASPDVVAMIYLIVQCIPSAEWKFRQPSEKTYNKETKDDADIQAASWLRIA